MKEIMKQFLDVKDVHMVILKLFQIIFVVEKVKDVVNPVMKKIMQMKKHLKLVVIIIIQIKGLLITVTNVK